MRTLALSALIMLSLSSCNWIKPSVKVPNLPYLQNNKTNTFKVGDKFILSESSNSCCMYCYKKDSTLSETMPFSPLLKFVETIEDIADPDCAGCSSHYYTVMECVATGTDTLRHFTIPMGSVGGASGCAELNRAILQTDANPITYIISVQN
ncbi:MAG: hypothetical protein POELPBGB_00279 [Bacteroidia bacterium]|nr:hypothetical protein [Bacteroidia bacterium]